ncbi:MAG: SDR family NAD(P)-dependent oxidoreductase [Myxococcales bacterium]|nr:SDR family NAD(P)-dependent oxidoreductase [Myxococcales bacterium]
MKELQGKVAAITGAASGIGLAMAKRFARAGMKLSLADREEKPLEAAATWLREGGAEVVTRVVDVSDADQMDAYAASTLETLGGVHLVCNNAGVGGGGLAWEMTTADWEFVLGPNLWGVIHGVRVFTKHLVEQNEGHVVNTASMAGLVSVQGLLPYNVSKHGVVTLSETLYADLQNANKDVGVSVLCPGFVNTQIANADRFRAEQAEDSPERRARQAMIDQFMAQAMSPDVVADMVHDAVVEGRFYVLTHSGTEQAALARVQRIVDGQNPGRLDAGLFLRGGRNRAGDN